MTKLTLQRAANGGLVVSDDDGALLAALANTHDLAVWLASYWPPAPGEIIDEGAMPTVLRSETPTRPVTRRMFGGAT